MKQFFCLLALLWVNMSSAYSNNKTNLCGIKGNGLLTGLELTNLSSHPVFKIQFAQPALKAPLTAIPADNNLQTLNITEMNTQDKTKRRFNPESSLSALAGNAANGSLKMSFTLTGYIDGFATNTGYSEKYGTIKQYAINSTLLSLYEIAFPELANLPPNRIIWSLKNIHSYKPDDQAWDDWKQTHALCFEFTTPAASFDQMPGMAKSILDNYFGLATGFEEREMPCLVLSANSNFKQIPKATRQFINTLGVAGTVQQLYGPVQQLCDYLDEQLPVPVINGLAGELVDISLPDKPPATEDAKNWLAPYGIEFISTVQKLQVFCIADAC